MGFSCRGMAGDLQVELGFRPGFGQVARRGSRAGPGSSNRLSQSMPWRITLTVPARPAPTAVVSGRQVFRRRSQIALGQSSGHWRLPPWCHRPGSAASPPTTPANATKSAPGRFYGSLSHFHPRLLTALNPNSIQKRSAYQLTPTSSGGRSVRMIQGSSWFNVPDRQQGATAFGVGPAESGPPPDPGGIRTGNEGSRPAAAGLLRRRK